MTAIHFIFSWLGLRASFGISCMDGMFALEHRDGSSENVCISTP